MMGLFLSGCFTAADVLSAEITLRGAAAHPDKLCPAKAKTVSNYPATMKCGPESAAKFKILIVSLDSNHSLELNLLENEYK